MDNYTDEQRIDDAIIAQAMGWPEEKTMDKVLMALLATQFSGLSREQLSGLSREQLSGLSHWQLSGLSREQLSGLSREQLSGLSREQLSGLSREQLSWLSREQLSGLSHWQLSWLSREQLSGLSREQLSWLSREQLSWLSREQLSWLSREQLSGLSREQLSGLSRGSAPKVSRLYATMADALAAQRRQLDQSTFGPDSDPGSNLCATPMCIAGHTVNLAGEAGYKLAAQVGFATAALLIHRQTYGDAPPPRYDNYPNEWALAYVEMMAERERQAEVR